jgi:hypothetical protein
MIEKVRSIAMISSLQNADWRVRGLISAQFSDGKRPNAALSRVFYWAFRSRSDADRRSQAGRSDRKSALAPDYSTFIAAMARPRRNLQTTIMLRNRAIMFRNLSLAAVAAASPSGRAGA